MWERIAGTSSGQMVWRAKLGWYRLVCFPKGGKTAREACRWILAHKKKCKKKCVTNVSQFFRKFPVGLEAAVKTSRGPATSTHHLRFLHGEVQGKLFFVDIFLHSASNRCTWTMVTFASCYAIFNVLFPQLDLYTPLTLIDTEGYHDDAQIFFRLLDSTFELRSFFCFCLPR